MPWQRYVVDVALEIDPETGGLAYQEVVLTVPRQSGKTTLLLALMTHRALGFGPPRGQIQNILYAAQTRNDSRKKFEDEHVKTLEACEAFSGLFRTRMTNGNEAILWRNGSKHAIMSTTEKAGHGETLDLGVLDEAFSQNDDRVEQALKPAMVTRADAQFWVTSTAGTADSLYLLNKVETGRALVASGLDRNIAYFEWSADPKADPADPATWYSCMPALDLTVRKNSVATFQKSMQANEFRRAFLNIADTASLEDWQVITSDEWAALIDTESKLVDPVAFCADVTPDRSFTSIAVAGLTKAGNLHVEVVEHRRGTGWAAKRLIELANRWKPCAVVIDAAGPAGSLIAECEKAELSILKPNAREVAQACGLLFESAVDTQILRHLDQPMLSAALAGAQKRNLGDAWAWARKGTSTDISPLVAITLAAWGFTTQAHLPSPITELKGSLMA